MADKCGFLTKEGGSFKTWKKRWFVLKQKVLYYSKDQSSGELGIIRLYNVPPEMISANDGYKKKKNVFEVRTPERTYYLSADTEELRDVWIAALRTGSSTSDSNQPVGLNDFDLLHVIGKGSFGKVYQIRNKNTSKVYAMKVLNKQHILETNQLQHTLTEKSILEKLAHPFLVNLHSFFQTPDKLCFIMDYINGGELWYHLQKERKFAPERARMYCAEVCLGLEYLHSNGIIYRDLKPENILLSSDGHICMTDFGISKEGLAAEDSKTATFCGTPEYLAPEILSGNGYTKAVDWWSFGTLMFEMLTGRAPFSTDDPQMVFSKIMYAPVEIPSSIADPDTRNILIGLLQRDPTQRLSSAAVVKSQPYFKSIDWEKLLNKEIAPLYIPPVSGEADVSMVDPELLKEPPIIESSRTLSSEAQKQFNKFQTNPTPTKV